LADEGMAVGTFFVGVRVTSGQRPCPFQADRTDLRAIKGDDARAKFQSSGISSPGRGGAPVLRCMIRSNSSRFARALNGAK
jgi:hypothetical protein